jgi:hypothetical protein
LSRNAEGRKWGSCLWAVNKGTTVPKGWKKPLLMTGWPCWKSSPFLSKMWTQKSTSSNGWQLYPCEKLWTLPLWAPALQIFHTEKAPQNLTDKCVLESSAKAKPTSLHKSQWLVLPLLLNLSVES